jgi:hypothetical protein
VASVDVFTTVILSAAKDLVMTPQDPSVALLPQDDKKEVFRAEDFFLQLPNGIGWLF